MSTPAPSRDLEATDPGPTPATDVPATSSGKGALISGFALPALLVVAWACALSGMEAPGGETGESTSTTHLRWILYYTGFVFIFSSVMHSVFAKKTAASIGWKTNGFQLELAAVSLGIGLGCLYAVFNEMVAMVAISIPVITFLFLAGVNHVVEIVRKRNYAPNNTLILIWDFGIPLSLVALLLASDAV
jgi:uncharacterized membrane protein HdeD (DUF308 family)